MSAAARSAIVACSQLSPQVGHDAENRLLISAALREAVEAGADVIVLPELSTSGYVFASREEAASAAISRHDAVFATWASVLRGTSAVAIVGFAEAADDGRLYNSAAILDASGVVQVYRKTHLWDREKLFFTAGDALPPIVDTAVGRIGVVICYDLEFPEMTRYLAAGGADLVAVPTNWPRVATLTGDQAPEIVIAMAMARINRVAIACCDRSGEERGQHWTEGTSVIDQNGDVLAAGAGSRLLTVSVDLAASRDKQLTERAHALTDRRTDLYGDAGRQERIT